jgi:ribosomal protein L11 methyltransferase
MTKIWHAVDVVALPDAAEAVEFALNELSSLGTEIDGLRKKSQEPLTITGFFDSPPSESEIRHSLDDALKIYRLSSGSIMSVAARIVEETDWLAEWKKHWKPQTVGKFVVAPPWAEVPETGSIVIRIEPNMAFGTGTHETTQLCLSAISDFYRPDLSVRDVGTGTGILAIAAAKLGGSDIEACDVDADSVNIARENALLNGVDERIRFYDGSIDIGTAATDVVFANLTLDVITPLLPLLVRCSISCLLLSGILADQRGDIVSSLKELGIEDPEITRAGEWISVLCRLS